MLLQVCCSPVVTHHGDTDEHAAADRHGDEEGQPVRTAPWKQEPIMSQRFPAGGGAEQEGCVTGGGQRGQCRLQLLVAEISVAALDGPPGLSVRRVLEGRVGRTQSVTHTHTQQSVTHTHRHIYTHICVCVSCISVRVCVSTLHWKWEPSYVMHPDVSSGSPCSSSSMMAKHCPLVLRRQRDSSSEGTSAVPVHPLTHWQVLLLASSGQCPEQ